MESDIVKHKFKVGDIIVGNEKSDERYNITRKGVKCEVVDTENFLGLIKVKAFKDDTFYNVNPEYFDLYKSVSDNDTTKRILKLNGIEVEVIDGKTFINIKDQVVIAFDDKVKYGVSSVDKEDTYCEEIGKSLAYYRANGGDT